MTLVSCYMTPCLNTGHHASGLTYSQLVFNRKRISSLSWCTFKPNPFKSTSMSFREEIKELPPLSCLSSCKTKESSSLSLCLAIVPSSGRRCSFRLLTCGAILASFQQCYHYDLIKETVSLITHIKFVL